MASHETHSSRALKYLERKPTSPDNYYYKALKSQETQIPNTLNIQDFQNSKSLTVEKDEYLNQKNRFQLIKSPTAFENKYSIIAKQQETNSENKNRPVTPTQSLEDEKGIHHRNLSISYLNQKNDEETLHNHQINVYSTKKGELDRFKQFEEQIRILFLENQELKNTIAYLETTTAGRPKQEKQLIATNTSEETQIELFIVENEQLKLNLNEQTKIIENTKNDLDKLMYTITLIEEENKKLTNQKECLLEYMEGLSRQLERSQKEIGERTREDQQTTVQGRNIQSIEGDDLLSGSGVYEMKIQRLNQDLKELSDLSSFLQQQLKLLATENAKITDEAATLQKQCHSLLTERNELERNGQFQQAELLRIREENNNLVHIHAEMSRRMKSMSEYEVQKTSFLEKDSFLLPYGEFLDKPKETEYFAIDHQDKDQQIKGLLKEIEQLRMILQGNKVKLEQERNTKTGEIRSLYEQNSDLRAQISSLQEENLKLFSQNNTLKEQITEQNNDMQMIKQQIWNKEKEIRDLSVKLEKSDQKIHELLHTIHERDYTIHELKNDVVTTQAKMLELESDCTSVHKNRENLLFEQKKQRELISKLKEQLTEKDQIIFNEIEDKEKAHKQFENTKKDLIELTKNLEAGLSEEERTKYTMPQLILNGSDVFIFVHERIRAVLLEKEKSKTRLEDLSALKDKIVDEKNKFERDNEMLYKNQLALQEEKDSLNKEITVLQSRCEEFEKEYANLCDRVEKEKNELLAQVTQELEKNHERLKEMEETCLKLETQKQELQFTIEKLKESTSNKGIIKIVDDIKDCHFEILRLQSERASFNSYPDYQDSVLFSFSGSKKSPKFNESRGIKRKIEELRSAIFTTDIDIQAQLTRKQSLEQELNETISREKIKSSQYSNLEKLTNQLRAEINILTKENELIEKAKFDLENSYHDLLRESSRKPQKSPLKDRSNLSFIHRESFDITDKKGFR